MTEHASGQRHADWFELFFDLVFVVTVSVVAHDLHGDPGFKEFGQFLFLFFPAWWAWVNLMVSVNLFGQDRVWTRIVLVLAMPGLGLMAAAMPEGFGDRAWAYALGAAWVRLGVFAIWWGRGRKLESAIPAWRPIIYGLLTAGVWAASAFVPEPWRYVMWGATIVLEMLLLTLGSGLTTRIYDRLALDHLVERIGLFVVIVFGETVFAIVLGLEAHFTVLSGAAAAGAFACVAILAITFFQWGMRSAEASIVAAQSRGALAAIRDAVMYLPFLLICAIVILAAALGTAVDEPDHVLPLGSRICLVLGIVGYYLLNAAIALRMGDPLKPILRWLTPAVLLPLIILIPLSNVLPGWATILAAAGVVLGIFTLNRLVASRSQPSRSAPRPGQSVA